jgi:hypothetical protein
MNEQEFSPVRLPTKEIFQRDNNIMLYLVRWLLAFRENLLPLSLSTSSSSEPPARQYGVLTWKTITYIFSALQVTDLTRSFSVYNRLRRRT